MVEFIDGIISFKGSVLWWNEENQLISIKSAGILEADTIQWILDQILNIARSHTEDIQLLFNWREVIKMTSKAKEILDHAFPKINYRKHAMIGPPGIHHTINEFMLAATSRKNTKLFTSDEEVLNWLIEK